MAKGILMVSELFLFYYILDSLYRSVLLNGIVNYR